MIPLTGTLDKLVSAVLACWALVLIYTAGFGALHPSVQGIVLFGQIALILCFLCRPFRKNVEPTTLSKVLDIMLILLSIMSCSYVLFRYEFWMSNPASATGMDIFFGTVLLLLILEAARRSVGAIIAVIALLIIAYALFGKYLPGNYGHRGFTFFQIIERLYTSGQGFSGLVVYIISTMVAIFIIAGGIFASTDMGQILIDIAKIASGRFRGGGGLISVVSSALFATISGSGPANVATTGTFTIPMMIRLKFKPELAAAVEAVASTGGQILPPIMGAGAFIMAEMLGKSYLKICIAAALPGVLYFLGAFMAIYFEALRLDLPSTPPEEIPKPKEVVRWPKFGPLITFVFFLLYFMIKGNTPQYSCFWALIIFSLIFITTTGKTNLKSLLSKCNLILKGLIKSGQTLIDIGIIALCVQIIISMVNLTGFGIKFSETIYSLAGAHLGLSLLLSAALIMLLGMGVPTTAAYLIGVSVVSTGLLSLGLQDLGVHLFIFYFACISLITPPVCIAVYIAASIADTPWFKAANKAARLGAAGYIVPFMFIFNPVLLMEGSFAKILVASLTAAVGVISLASGLMGFLFKKNTLLDRGILCSAAICLIKPGVVTDFIGVVLICTVISIQLLNLKKNKQTSRYANQSQ